MAVDAALEVVRGYHRAWTGRNFEAAIRLLAPDLRVEVPINAYPTKEAFAQALTAFGSLVRSVVLLAEFSKGSEAMLLYDMDVDRLGTLRVAEHFTVVDGRIARIRQIHDTAPVRAAGFVQA
jgi:ketosteroid isomerase-like protein